MVRDLHERLEQQGTNIQDWLKQTGKDEKSVVDEMRGIAQSRLVLRFGMQELAEKLNVEPNAENLGAALKAHKTQASAGETDTTPADFEKGGRIYENIRNELRMQALQERLMGS
jgi:FKBP-type peptidyl-prolyl cis-trans isomerase (trigger factor)